MYDLNSRIIILLPCDTAHKAQDIVGDIPEDPWLKFLPYAYSTSSYLVSSLRV